MDAQRRIAVYGTSIILGAVEASLRRHPQFEVTAFTRTATAEELAALAPDVILFDAGVDVSGPDLALLRLCPQAQLIGIDPDRNVATVWSGQQLRELSTQDLVALIEPHTSLPMHP